ncbi:MAG TPA: YraN family protein [Terriglobales bacterium]|nr:YraN family protein [Terriglobales bacterium]
MGLAQEHGHAGEALAAAYLELAGLEVLRRNVRLGGVEVDLVAREGRTRVVVEVKLRGRADYGGAIGAVDARKRARLRRAALALLAEREDPVRVDVIAMDLTPEGLALRHVRNAVTDGR